MKKTISLVLVLALGLSAEVANADFTFGTPTNLGPTVNSSADDGCPSISADGLIFYFASGRPGGFSTGDIWVVRRATTSDPWDNRMNLGQTVNSSDGDFQPAISADGSTIFFMSDRPGGSGGADLWVTTRAMTEDPWQTPQNLGPTINSEYFDGQPSISADGLELYFTSDRPGGYGSWDIRVTTRPTKHDPWSTPVNLGPTINSSTWDYWPSISADGLILFFSSHRPGGFGSGDIWVVRRATTSDPWDNRMNLGQTVNSSDWDGGPNISADGFTLYFCSNRPGGQGGYDIWQVSIELVVDFNDDGIVDCADMCMMVDHWHTDDPLYDIAPVPFGDGIVDIQDLIVLSEHLFEEVNDPTLVAHWALDEAEGDIASDSANDNDGTVYGDPAWQPDGGIVDGALELDGIDDYVSTPFVLNPADGKFSVFAWIKDSTPGQAILSQMGGVNWLCVDSLEGNLMTELKASGRGAAILLSQAVITDGNWHRVGFVWDGSSRTLYVDDTAVAEDAQTNLEASENGLYIGAGTAMETGSFWSGLIDDVRIYNRAVIP